MPSECCILCPGQGAQIVGMGQDFLRGFSVARQTFEEGNRLLGFDLSAICFTGPEERLNETDISQPAIYVTSVACFRAAEHAGFLAREDVAACAGLSLGEYTALHLAGVFSFEDGLRLVAARGRFMQEAATAVPSGMVAILGADETVIEELCRQASQGEVLVPANFNAPGQIVISGSAGACQRATEAATAAGYRATPLKVAGAFHSPLMQPAADRMAVELDKVEFHPPSRAVFANVTGQPHGDAASIKRLLVDQIVRPVRWDQIMAELVSRPGLRFIELAPGRTLTGLAKKINRRLAVESLGTADTLTHKETQS